MGRVSGDIMKTDFYDECFQRYEKWAPTPLDTAGLSADRLDIGKWYVMPTGQNRDSGARTQSNFAAFLRGLRGESAWVEVHRFGHWGPGWVEIILVKPTARKTLANAYEMSGALQDYPVLDEEDLSEREYEAACESWSNTDTQDRIAICGRHGVSIFAARRDEIPSGLPHYDDFYRGE